MAFTYIGFIKQNVMQLFEFIVYMYNPPKKLNSFVLCATDQGYGGRFLFWMVSHIFELCLILKHDLTMKIFPESDYNFKITGSEIELLNV